MSALLNGAERFRVKSRYFVLALMAGLALLVVIKPVLAHDNDAVITGVVFADRDADGIQDANEPGIAGVGVSDGQVLDKTDDSGSYSLKIDTQRRTGDIVFVTVPSGYGVPANKDRTPQFYKQLGDVKPGEQRNQDFALLKTPESSNPNFTFANLADVHVEKGTTNNLERFSGQLSQVNALTEQPAFIAVSGDLTNRATDAEFQDYTAAASTSGIPVYPAVGNHDVAAGTSYGVRLERYRSYLGPEWYSFDYGNRHFVTLENNLGFGEKDQLEWLRQDLELNAGDKEVVVIVHKPLNTPQTPNGAKAYIDLLGHYNTVLVLMGHTHVNDVAIDTIPGAAHITTNSSSYTIDQTPNGFRHVSFKGGEAQTPFKMYNVDQSLTIVHPANGSKIGQDKAEVLVNAYDTSREVREVEYRIDGGAWKKLKPSSDFSWTDEADFKNEAAGNHRIEVKVTDTAGKSWSRTNAFEVVGKSSLPVIHGGSDWPMFHGNAQHTGQAADLIEPGLRLAWSYRTPGSILTSSPAIVDGRVFIGTRDENGAEHQGVHAVDLETGNKLWYFKSDAQIQSSPAVAKGIVYASSIRGTLYALDERSGEKLWEKTVGTADVSRAWMYYSPTVAEDVLYQAYSTGGGSAIMALDAKTGAELWSKPLAGGWIAENSPVYEDGKVYVGADGGWLIVLDAKTGSELWRKQPAGGWMHSMPAVKDGRVYMGYQGGILVALDAATGEELWRYRSPDTSYIPGNATGSSPAIADNTVYMGMPDGNVVALDAVKGTLLWSYRTQGGIISSAAVSGDTVFIGSNDGNLYSIDRTTGQPLSQYEIGAWVASSPAVSGNALVVGAFDGNLYAFTSGGESAKRWPRVTGHITESSTGEPVGGAKIVAVGQNGESKTVAANSDGAYTIGLLPGTYTLKAEGRGYMDSPASTLELADDGKPRQLDLKITRIDHPIAGVSAELPDFNSASPRLDVEDGDTFHYAMNNRIQSNVSGKIGANNTAGTFQPGWLADVALLDDAALETIDWSELILSARMNDPKVPWNRKGEWLTLNDIQADGDTVRASGTAQIDASLKAAVSYKTLPDAPVVKMTLELENTGTSDFKGYFQYLLDPDSSDDTAYVPGLVKENPGFVTAGWKGNYVYDGPKSAVKSPAHAIAWTEEQPAGLSAFGYIFGVWFDASVPAGGKRSVSWYHITDYPAAGSDVTANIAKWASRLDVLDDEVEDQSRAEGIVTDAETGLPVQGANVEAIGGNGSSIGSGSTDAEGRYSIVLPPGAYTLKATKLSYSAAAGSIGILEGKTARLDMSMKPVLVDAGTGKKIEGPTSEGTLQDIIMENRKLTMAIAAVSEDPQLSGATKGKPIDIAVKGQQDQTDWFNLPYLSLTLPAGTEAWQQLSVKNSQVQVLEVTDAYAKVRTAGVFAEDPGISVETTYTLKADEEWVTAETVINNSAAEPKSVWIGDAIDYDGAGQKSGVSGHEVITTPYSEPQPYTPSQPWIGMSGNDGQVYGLIYDGDMSGMTAYGNGNWMMSRIQAELPAGGSYTLVRRIAAVPGSASEDPFAVLSELYNQQ
ncbi:PQQ-binding-like beta-propeller repeat protein [Paenibacillus sp. N4]|uniref:outer membrane protein assembly factor BamB family protein n=1 Tax=Paenibacillus vietnamensis TaxID=2590547 RepID=UPI001CD193DF|nr:PQQ-binding-like beta-propeller repeat protein [Paenibacillus vietnamensis]MCA0757614.1 PQQ-binding-like beta-propeller repeat protein [Paenibacillus vietnamensis]